jgi:hypothetical protein
MHAYHLSSMTSLPIHNLADKAKVAGNRWAVAAGHDQCIGVLEDGCERQRTRIHISHRTNISLGIGRSAGSDRQLSGNQHPIRSD